MKCAEYRIENQKVEFFNSFLGVEKVKVNSKTESEKFSWWGTNHYLKIGNNNYTFRPNINFISTGGIGVEILKNGLPFEGENIIEKGTSIPDNIQFLMLLIFFIGIWIGFSMA
jgi:hypothetical protein